MRAGNVLKPSSDDSTVGFSGIEVVGWLDEDRSVSEPLAQSQELRAAAAQSARTQAFSP
jgi:hypothetical protein